MGIWTCDLHLPPARPSEPPRLTGECRRAQKSGPPKFKYRLTSQVPLGKQCDSKSQIIHLQIGMIIALISQGSCEGSMGNFCKRLGVVHSKVNVIYSGCYSLCSSGRGEGSHL